MYLFQPPVWQSYIADSCALSVAGIVDVFILAHSMNLILYFLFLRSEYLRYQDATLYQSIAEYAEYAEGD